MYRSTGFNAVNTLSLNVLYLKALLTAANYKKYAI
ncbi:hypothetical protein SAMN05444377_1242 [Flavobacterium fontis]|uniref:Uncharacterized protein n=1 Tax=Flavobacterium fontis TaxID=1124188 RepID=A0A1M5EZM1_9FLAO|nr:hypothetical protein SAMN05444377_1242 [Flavobacterium fontis]